MSSSTEPKTTTAEEYKTFGEIIWGQFKQYRVSYYCLYGIAAMFILAMVCPLLVFNIPFYIYVPEEVVIQEGLPETMAGASFPWLAALFDHNIWNSGADIFFNFLLFYIPFSLLLWLGITRAGNDGRLDGDGGKGRFWFGIASLLVVFAALVLGFHLGDFFEAVSQGTAGETVGALLWALAFVALVAGLVFGTHKIDSGGKDPHRQRRMLFVLVAGVIAAFGFIAVFMSGFRQPFIDYTTIAGLDDSVRALFPPIDYSYRAVNLEAVSTPPSAEHWLGTDREGRDVFTRILYGTRISLTIGVVAVSLYVAIGMLLGSLAGFFGGKTDTVILRLIEIVICFPTIFLLLTLAGFIEDASVFHIMLIIGLVGWTGIARLVRGEFLRLRNQDFVQAATALGLKR